MGRFFSALKMISVLLALSIIAACSSGGLTDTPATGGGGSGTTQKAATIALYTSPVSIKTGDLETSTVTATVLDKNNAAVKNLIVIFNATGGKLSDSSAITDEDGKARVTFSSGIIDPSNRIITITGTASGLSASAPITITGSTLTISTDKTNITNDGSVMSTMTITAKDAVGTAIYNTPITLSVGGTGGATLSKVSGNTDPLGQLSVTVTGNAAGMVAVTATGLGTSAIQSYTISHVGEVFGITSPADDPYALSTNTDLTITVNAPGVTTVRFAATMGFFDGLANQQVVDKAVVSGYASVVFRSSLAGVASIQVSDKGNPSKTDNLEVAISAPASAAAEITLQTSLSSVAPSTGGVLNTAKLTARVLTGPSGQAVGNAPVQFSIVNPTGGGETVYPVIVYTDGMGRAFATFQSGALSSGAQGITVRAQIIGTSVAATVNIVTGGTPGSVIVGRGSNVIVHDSTTYKLPMSVTVADANGNPVQGRQVSLNLWPTQYSTGLWYDSDPDPEKEKYVPYVTGTFINEDINEDMYKNTGEDVNFNGFLDPPNSASGTVPATVTTDQDGVGTFYITYPKQSAVWIVARVRASVEVSGTETTSVLALRLPAERTEAEAGNLPNSNYDIELAVTAGGTVTYNLPLFSANAIYTTSYYPSSSISATGVYSFTAPGDATSDKPYYDTIYVQAPLYGTLPVRVVINIK